MSMLLSSAKSSRVEWILLPCCMIHTGVSILLLNNDYWELGSSLLCNACLGIDNHDTSLPNQMLSRGCCGGTARLEVQQEASPSHPRYKACFSTAVQMFILPDHGWKLTYGPPEAEFIRTANSSAHWPRLLRRSCNVPYL